MQIKGTAVKVTSEFVKKRYTEHYETWLNSMPVESQNIFSKPVFATSWYPLSDAVIVPSQKVGEMFFPNIQDACWEIGRYSADIALNGIYKIFLKVSSPNFILGRATSVFNTYYNPGNIEIIEKESNNATLKIKNFKVNEKLIMYRIAGWLERTIEITKKDNIKVELDFKEDGEDLISTIYITWT